MLVLSKSLKFPYGRAKCGATTDENGQSRVNMNEWQWCMRRGGGRAGTETETGTEKETEIVTVAWMKTETVLNENIAVISELRCCEQLFQQHSNAMLQPVASCFICCTHMQMFSLISNSISHNDENVKWRHMRQTRSEASLGRRLNEPEVFYAAQLAVLWQVPVYAGLTCVQLFVCMCVRVCVFAWSSACKRANIRAKFQSLFAGQ